MATIDTPLASKFKKQVSIFEKDAEKNKCQQRRWEVKGVECYAELIYTYGYWRKGFNKN